MRTKKPKSEERAYCLRVFVIPEKSPKMSFGKHNLRLSKKKNIPWREIIMLETHSLYQFAESIIQAFDFDFDHCFGFFSSLDTPFKNDSSEKYELFVDIGEDPPLGSRAVKTALLKNVFPYDGKKMLFYFDYGDGWHFRVERVSELVPNKVAQYPLFRESVTESPEQYPDFEE
jgi:hypothetical protein